MIHSPDTDGRDRRARFDTAIANTGAGAGGEIADLGLRTVGSLLMARVLGPAGLGSWLVARTVAFDLGNIVARCGLDEAVLRFVARSHGRRESQHARGVLKAGFVWSLLTALAAMTLLFLAAPFLGSVAFRKPEVTGLIRLLVPSLLLWAPLIVILAGLQGINRVALRVAAQKIAFPLTQAAMLGAALAAGWGMTGVIASHYGGIGAMTVVTCALGLRTWRRQVGTGPEACNRRELAAFAGPFALNELSTFVVLWIDILMLGVLSTRSEAGIYGAAQRVAGLVALPLNAVNVMFSPMIASLHGLGDRRGLAEMYSLTTRWVVFASLPLFVLIAFAGGDVLALFGDGFRTGYVALLLLSIGRVVSSASGSVGYMLNMTGFQKLNLLNSVVLGVTNAVLNALWIGRWGALGAAAAAAISLGLVNIIRVIEVRVCLGLSFFSRGYWVILAGAGAGAGAVAILRHAWHGMVGAVALGAVFLLVYVGVTVLFGLDDADREAAAAVVRRIRTRCVD